MHSLSITLYMQVMCNFTSVQCHHHKLSCQKNQRESNTSLTHLKETEFYMVSMTVSSPNIFLLCLSPSLFCVLSQGAQHGACQSRWDTKVSSEEAAVCLSHRQAAAEDWSQIRRPAADGCWFLPHCGNSLTDNKLGLVYTDAGEST